jgi:ATP-binding cassette subfamily F protein uup
LLLISHDREFLNNVVTSTIVFESAGVKEYVGGYDDWLRQRPDPATEPAGPRRGASTTTKTQSVVTAADTTPAASQPQRRRLTYREQQELAALPGTIEQLEAELAQWHEAMAQPDFYKRPGDQIAADQSRLTQLEDRLTASYARWEALDARL